MIKRILLLATAGAMVFALSVATPSQAAAPHGALCQLAGTASFGDCADHLEGLVTIEWRYFDRHDIWDLGEKPPELETKRAASDCRLQVEAE